MIVWLIWVKSAYEADYLWGIYATEQVAKDAIERARKRGVNVGKFVIDEQDVVME